MNKATLRWWVIACCLAIITAVFQYKGLFVAMWDADRSKISALLLIIFYGVTAYIGVLTYKLSTIDHERLPWLYQQQLTYVDPCWFFAENFMNIGMCGTLIGLIMMLSSIVGIDTSTIQGTKAAILTMGHDMATAFVTTLVGLATSVLAKLQMVNVDMVVAQNAIKKTSV